MSDALRTRGVISDYNAYLRFKKTIRRILSDSSSGYHTVGKSPYEDDTIVIHGLKKGHLGSYFVMAPVHKTVPKIFELNGIEFVAAPKTRLGRETGIWWVRIPVDQAAYPQVKRRKTSPFICPPRRDLDTETSWSFL